eukprot:gene4642-5249_t
MPNQLLSLADILLESHSFAKTFKNSFDQRTLLWKAGFIKGKSRPNLLKQETSSLACVFRILFAIYTDRSKQEYWQDIESRLFKILKEIMGYYISLESVKHRDAWTSLLVSIFTKLLKLDNERFKKHIGILYLFICEMETFDIKLELRSVLYKFSIRIGHVYAIFPAVDSKS